MESADLVELPRKELKQLCREHNIRTAGVKHDDLVRLLRNKLYPPAPGPPRLQKAGNQGIFGSQTSSKSASESAAKTSWGSASQGRSQRSLAFVDGPSQEKAPERKRELSPSPLLSWKPVLTKSNSTPAQRSNFLRKKVSNTVSGLSKQSHGSPLQKSDGSSDKSRSINGAQSSSIRNTSMAIKRPGERQGVKTNGAPKTQTNIDGYSEAASSPRASEGDASVATRDSSGIGSHSFGSVSEIATDAGHAISEDSENDDRRSVSSEPALRFPSQINRLTPRKSSASKLGREVHPSWDSGHGRDSLDSSARNYEVHGQDSDPLAAHDDEELFPYFLEDTESLIGDTDGLDSFLDAGIADPEDKNRTDGRQVDLEQFRTSETHPARHDKHDIFRSEGKLKEEVTIISDNEVSLTTDHGESELGDCSLMDHKISERAGVFSTKAVLPSEADARTEILNTEISEGSLPVEKPHAVADAELHIAPNLDHKLASASVTNQNSAGSAEHVEDIPIISRSVLELVSHRVEDVEPPVPTQVHVAVKEPEKRSHIEAYHLCDSPSSSGQKKSGEAAEALSDLVYIGDQHHGNQGLRVEFKRVLEGDVASAHVRINDEDLTDTLTTSREDSKQTEAASTLSEKIDDNGVSGEHEQSQVVVTTGHADFENKDIQDSESGTPVHDASDSVSEDIKLTSEDPVERSIDMKWSPVSALYEDLEDVNKTLNDDGYDLLGLKRAGTGNNLEEDTEPRKHLCGPVSEAMHHAEEAAIDANTDGGVVQKFFGIPSSTEIASKSDKQEEAEYILQDKTSEIARQSDSFPNGVYATGAEAACDGQKHEGTGSQLPVIPLDIDSNRLSGSDVTLRVSRQNVEPVRWSGDEEADESAKSQDLFRSREADVFAASTSGFAECESSMARTLTQPTFEDVREENVSASVNLQSSTVMEEDTETWSTCEREGHVGISIRAHALAGGTQSSTGLKERGSRLSPSQDPQEDTLSHGPKHLSELVPNKLDNTSASSHPRNIKKILTVGLKMILVIGSITLGILKFRASRSRIAEKP